MALLAECLPGLRRMYLTTYSLGTFFYTKTSLLGFYFSLAVHTDEAFELFLSPYIKQSSSSISISGGNKFDTSPQTPTKTRKNHDIYGHLLNGTSFAFVWVVWMWICSLQPSIIWDSLRLNIRSP
jgi:hypothetical protein